MKLRVDLEDFDGNITYAEYTTFKVADKGDKYRLECSLPLKIKIMMLRPIIALSPLKAPVGTWHVTLQTSTDSTLEDRMPLMLMGSTGIPLEDIIIP